MGGLPVWCHTQAIVFVPVLFPETTNLWAPWARVLRALQGLPWRLFSSPRCLLGISGAWLRSQVSAGCPGRGPSPPLSRSPGVGRLVGPACEVEAAPVHCGGVPLSSHGLCSTGFPFRDSLAACSGCQRC